MVIMMGGCARVLVIMFILIAVFELIALIFCFSQRVDVAQGVAQSKKSSMCKKNTGNAGQDLNFKKTVSLIMNRRQPAPDSCPAPNAARRATHRFGFERGAPSTRL